MSWVVPLVRTVFHILEMWKFAVVVRRSVESGRRKVGFIVLGEVELMGRWVCGRLLRIMLQ